MQLSGRVIPEFNHAIHTIDPLIGKIPVDWMVTAMIDTHLKLPHAITFFATDKYDRIYVFAETWDSLTPDEIADEIVRMKTKHSIRLENAFFDPLSKGDTEYIRRLGTTIPDTFSTVESKISPFGISCAVATKDKKSGIANIRAGFKKDARLSTIFICNDCTHTIEELNNWVYDKDTNKPRDEDDHFVENLYRATLTGVRYSPLRTTNIYQQEAVGVV